MSEQKRLNKVGFDGELTTIEIELAVARNYFMQELEKLSSILEQLKKDVFPNYKKSSLNQRYKMLDEFFKPFNLTADNFYPHEGLVGSANQHAELLRPDFVIQTAIRTLDFWVELSEPQPTWEYLGGPIGHGSSPLEPPPKYYPLTMSRKEYRENIELYIKQEEQYHIDRGAKKPKKKWSLEHIEWLIRWNVQSWKRRQIEEYYGKYNDEGLKENLAPQTVDEFLLETAAMLCMELREGESGRPRKL